MRGAGGRRVRRRDRGRRAWLWFWVSAVVVVFVAASFASLARARVPGRGGGVVVVLAVPQGASAGGLARLSGSTRGFAGGSAVQAQRKTGAGWTQVASGRTSKRGVFVLTFAIPP